MKTNARTLPLVWAVFLLSGCEPSTPSDTVESLAANPERLKALRERCRLDRVKVGEELCAKVGQATTQRFLKRAEPSEDHAKQ
ncbi:TPA: EexN family lipoprotein [Pseudomonas aeruginosa]|nr:EexN family lipoprotein [Pseudomonas aeruginosa]